MVSAGRRVTLFLSRQAMIRYLLKMYDKAEAGDVIWAQFVRCADFGSEVRSQILKAAGRGVQFRMIINEHSPAAEEFRALSSTGRNLRRVRMFSSPPPASSMPRNQMGASSLP